MGRRAFSHDLGAAVVLLLRFAVRAKNDVSWPIQGKPTTRIMSKLRVQRGSGAGQNPAAGVNGSGPEQSPQRRGLAYDEGVAVANGVREIGVAMPPEHTRGAADGQRRQNLFVSQAAEAAVPCPRPSLPVRVREPFGSLRDPPPPPMTAFSGPRVGPDTAWGTDRGFS
jgi:hypothetical protein